MTSVAWPGVYRWAVRVLGAGDDGRRVQVAAQLAAARDSVTSGETAQTVAVARWQARIAAILAEDPDVPGPLAELVASLPASEDAAQAAPDRPTVDRAVRMRPAPDEPPAAGRSRLAVPGLAALAVLVAVLVGDSTRVYPWLRTPDLDSGTPCRVYLRADTGDRMRAAQRISAGNPAAWPALDDRCRRQPDAPIGRVVTGVG